MKNVSLLLQLLLLVPAFLAAQGSRTSRPAAAPLRVGLLLLAGVYNSELMAPLDVFQHTIYHTLPGMSVCTVGRDRRPVKSFEGLLLTPDHGLMDCPPLDVLVVPSAAHNMDTDLEDKALLRFVAARGRSARYVLSLCDGAFILAAAGLLSGRAVTTFPGDIPAFRKRFPALDVREGVSFVADGKVITGAGGARSYDPALYLVEHLYGARVARGIGRGLVIAWDLSAVAHQVVAKPLGSRAAFPSWLPGKRVDPGVSVEKEDGSLITLQQIFAAHEQARGLLLAIVGGAEGRDVRHRGGFWCEDSFNEMPLIRHLQSSFEPRGILFVGVACPPVFDAARFGYPAETFLRRPSQDPLYQQARRLFVRRTLALQQAGLMPFSLLTFDPRLRLLGRPAPGRSAPLGTLSPTWQGRFKWPQDNQTYGTPTLWVLKRDLTVFGLPFFGNNYEVPGRPLRYTTREVARRLTRLLLER